jgi:hypothetical protein
MIVWFNIRVWLKTERYGKVQVVLLLSLTNVYQDVSYEVDLKYGNGDITESSLVSSRSKGDLAGHEPLLSTFGTENC